MAGAVATLSGMVLKAAAPRGRSELACQALQVTSLSPIGCNAGKVGYGVTAGMTKTSRAFKTVAVQHNESDACRARSQPFFSGEHALQQPAGADKPSSLPRLGLWWSTRKAGSSSGSSSSLVSLQDRITLLVRARKRSGFADLLFNKRVEDAEKKKRLQQGQVSPKLEVPKHIQRPPYADSGVNPPWDTSLQIQDEEGIKRMRAAGKLAAEVRDYAGTLVKPGITTDEIDKAVHKMIIEAGAYPSPLNYGKFPKSVCTSVNECICHGIPDSRPLEDGDIINIDVTVYLNGHHGDTSTTFLVGNVDPEVQKLVRVTKEALDMAIAICGPGVELKKIGKTIHEHADKYKYGVVRHFVGHGVGKTFHSGPAVLHYRNNAPGILLPGMTFTIEPMLSMGSTKEVMWDDNWTVVTEDGSWSAQFEHTLLITDTGVEILTAP